MQTKITCPFTIPSSHKIHEVGFRGDNNLKLTLPFLQENFMALRGTSLEIIDSNDGGYYFIVLSDSLHTKKKQVEYIEKAAEFVSFLINRDEANPHYGINFVQVEWFELKAVQLDESGQQADIGLTLSDSLSISSTRTVSFDGSLAFDSNYHDLFRFYFDGLRAEHKKSKYFHWFLILEFLEKTEKYKAMFDSNKLFDESEVQQLEDVANKMGNGVKKSAVLQLLSRTKEFRYPKLLQLINSLGINNITSLGKTETITEETIKRIVDGRNKLFHSGTDVSEATLWFELFPLTTQLVEYIYCNPECLNA
jgi:hypothetical protein